MAICKSMCSVMRMNFYRWRYDRRIWIIFLFMGLVIIQELKGYTEYGLDSGEQCTGFLLPVLYLSGSFGIGVMKTMLYLGCMLILCDAPFMYQSTPYVILRSRRDSWWMGECTYILLATLLYTIFVVVISTVTVLPIATFGDSWGGVLRDFAYGNGEMYAGDLNKYYNIHLISPTDAMGYLYPVGAQMFTFFSVWASYFFLGLLQYLISLISKSKFLGFVSAAVLIFLDPIIYGISDNVYLRWMLKLTPVTWVDVNNLYMWQEPVLSIPYIAMMFGVLILFLLLLIRMVSKKVVIEVRGEV